MTHVHLDCTKFLNERRNRRGFWAGFYDGLSFLDGIEHVKRHDIVVLPPQNHPCIDGFKKDRASLLNDYWNIKRDIEMSFITLKSELDEQAPEVQW